MTRNKLMIVVRTPFGSRVVVALKRLKVKASGPKTFDKFAAVGLLTDCTDPVVLVFKTVIPRLGAVEYERPGESENVANRKMNLELRVIVF